jgi:hypothetical protein
MPRSPKARVPYCRSAAAAGNLTEAPCPRGERAPTSPIPLTPTPLFWETRKGPNWRSLHHLFGSLLIDCSSTDDRLTLVDGKRQTRPGSTAEALTGCCRAILVTSVSLQHGHPASRQSENSVSGPPTRSYAEHAFTDRYMGQLDVPQHTPQKGCLHKTHPHRRVESPGPRRVCRLAPRRRAQAPRRRPPSLAPRALCHRCRARPSRPRRLWARVGLT